MQSAILPTSYESLASREAGAAGAAGARRLGRPGGDTQPGQPVDERRQAAPPGCKHKVTATARPTSGTWAVSFSCQRTQHLVEAGGRRGADGTIRGEAARSPAPRGASPPPQRHFRKTTLSPGASSAGAKIMKKPYIPPNYCGLQLGINPAAPRSPQPLPAGFSPPLL